MSEIPRAVLSEHFQERMKGRRLVSAVFTTFRLEPSFFETEVLPVFFDIPLSHAPAIKLIQLEEALREIPGGIAVYYDQSGLVADGGPAKLDIRRFPIRHPTGIFHPKNVLALVEDEEPDEENKRSRAVLCSCSSANLTRAGWWENVEVGHVEEIGEGDHTSLRDPLLAYLDSLVAAVERGRPNDERRAAHHAVRDLREFLKKATQRTHRSIEGRLLPHFHDGRSSLPDFIEDAAGRTLDGMNLEVISPYFDDHGISNPLETLIQRFAPKETRLYLPQNDRGEALCSEDFFSWVKSRAKLTWGGLPGDLLRLGKAEDAKHRTVHAKVYRFFEPKRGGREVFYVGSTNLTTAGCRISGRGGNWETGFLVELPRGARPDWWLAPENHRPAAFGQRSEDEGAAAVGGTSLVLRFRWDTHQASAFWGNDRPAPTLAVRHGGAVICELAGLPSREWINLDNQQSARLEQVLRSTSLLEVVGESGEPGLLLVQEEGMSHRPSLLFELSAADILRYWSLLTIEQRAAFIEARVKVAGDDDPLLAHLAPLPFESTLFDRFAGIFHAFECLDDRVEEALDAGKEREADYRLFGRKYDSLGSLLDRVFDEVKQEKGDRVEQYVIALCARQLTKSVARRFPDYWIKHSQDVKSLELRLRDTERIRKSIEGGNPEMPAFLDWFDRWFLERAAPLSEGEVL